VISIMKTHNRGRSQSDLVSGEASVLSPGGKIRRSIADRLPQGLGAVSDSVGTRGGGKRQGAATLNSSSPVKGVEPPALTSAQTWGEKHRVIDRERENLRLSKRKKRGGGEEGSTPSGTGKRLRSF